MFETITELDSVTREDAPNGCYQVCTVSIATWAHGIDVVLQIHTGKSKHFADGMIKLTASV